jgi:hypothetical protein
MGIGCGGETQEEKSIVWKESTGTITKVSDNTWKFEFATEKGPFSITIPGPEPANVGVPVKIKYNQADPNAYKLIK